MQVTVSHHVDASAEGADGSCEFSYEYDLFTFSDETASFLVRSYSGELKEAHFQARLDGSERHFLTERDLRHPLFIEAAAYLRTNGKPSLSWLGTDGYLPLPG